MIGLDLTSYWLILIYTRISIQKESNQNGTAKRGASVDLVVP